VEIDREWILKLAEEYKKDNSKEKNRRTTPEIHSQKEYPTQISKHRNIG